MKKYLFILLLAVTSAGFAQSADNVWTMRECVDYAVANNLNVMRSVYSRETGEINALQSKLVMLPSVSANGNTGFNWGRNIDPSTNSFVTERITSANMSASGSLLLWNGFRQYYTMKQNVTEFDALSEDLIKAKNDVILNVINLYMGVIFNQELLGNAQSQLNSTQQQLDRTRKLADAGSVPKANVLNLEAQNATNELNQIQRENALNLSLLQLKQALQLPASTIVEIEIPIISVERDLMLDQSSDEIFATAVNSMPEIKAAQLRKRSAEYALRSARGSYYPRISLNGSLSSIYSSARKEFLSDGTYTVLNSDPTQQFNQIGFVPGTNDPIFATRIVPGGDFREVGFKQQYNDNLGRSLGLNISVPLFNGYATRANVKRSVISREQARIGALQQENTLRQTVETAVNDVLAAHRTYISSEKQVQARDEAFRMTKQRFDAGAANFVEYQVAENDLFQAKSDMLRAKYDLIFRKKLIDFYQGKPILD
jgi:outer membrane protein